MCSVEILTCVLGLIIWVQQFGERKPALHDSESFGARNDFIPVPYSVHQDHPETNHRQELSGQLQNAHRH
jgi:hypothetical protein